MAVCQWVVVCDSAIIDVSGKVTLVGIFRNIAAREYPAVHPLLTVGMRFSGGPREPITFKIRIIRPDGLALMDAFGNGQLDEQGMAVLAFPFSGVPIPAAGLYKCEVSVESTPDSKKADVVFSAETLPSGGAPPLPKMRIGS